MDRPFLALVDTHCHLNDPAFAETLAGVLERARAAGVRRFVVPSYDQESLKRTSELAANYSGIIFPAFAIHPWYVAEDTDYDEVSACLAGDSPVAVGETGLDFSSGCPPRELQIDALTRHLEFAERFDVPVILHCRKAHDRLYQALKACGGRIRGVMHSFSGSPDHMHRFLDLGLFIAFSGSVTRETARKYHRNAAQVPLDRLLVETDAPAIATETTMAWDVEPLHAMEVARKIADIRGNSLEEICEQTTRNATLLFRLP